MILASLLAATLADSSQRPRARAQELRGRLGMQQPQGPQGTLRRCLWLLDQPWMTTEIIEQVNTLLALLHITVPVGMGYVAPGQAATLEDYRHLFLGQVPQGHSRFDVMIPWLARQIYRGHLRRAHAYAFAFRERGGDDEDVLGMAVAAGWLREIADWVQARSPDLSSMTFHEAMISAEAYHQEIQFDLEMDFMVEQDRRRDLRDSGLEEHPVVVHRWPDGAELVRLVSPHHLTDEGRQMRHCIGDYWGDVSSGEMLAFSYRDPDGKRRVTFAVLPGKMRPDFDLSSPSTWDNLYESMTMQDYQGFANGVILDPVAALRCHIWLREHAPDARGLSSMTLGKMPPEVRRELSLVPVPDAVFDRRRDGAGAARPDAVSRFLDYEAQRMAVQSEIEEMARIGVDLDPSRSSEVGIKEGYAFDLVLPSVYHTSAISMVDVGADDFPFSIQDTRVPFAAPVIMVFRRATPQDPRGGWWRFVGTRRSAVTGQPLTSKRDPALHHRIVDALEGDIIRTSEWLALHELGGVGSGSLSLLPQRELLEASKQGRLMKVTQ